MSRFFAIMGLIVSSSGQGAAAAETPGATNAASKFPFNEADVPHYTAYRTKETLKIDGRLDEKSWIKAPRSERFVDILTGQPTKYDTRTAVVWNDEMLYIGFWIEEPNVTASLTERDSPIYQNNDVEVFIAGKDAYYEFEINALNTIYEVFFVWDDAYEKGGFSKIPQLKKSNPKVHPFNGVGFTTHPRGLRTGSWDWDFPGLQTAVHIDGTLNNDKDQDRGWTVELAFPWAGMKDLFLSEERSIPPKNGDVLRIDFSRFNQYKTSTNDSSGWFLSPHKVWDSHIPEAFAHVHFSTREVGTVKAGAKK